MFLHGGPVHILFNMLGIWMFGVELERLWGTRQFFVKYYAITGIGAGSRRCWRSDCCSGRTPKRIGAPTIGASGALYGLLVAFALLLSRSPAPDVLPVPDSRRSTS